MKSNKQLIKENKQKREQIKEQNQIIRDQQKVIKNQEVRIHQKLVDKISTLMISAFGLVAALAWNEAIKAIFSEFLGQPDHIIGWYLMRSLLRQ